jgi:hypothetical protein
VQQYQDKLFPLQGPLNLKHMAVEIIKTGRRIWLTVRVDPATDTIDMADFMSVKERLADTAREVYQNTQTEVLLERK